MRNGNLHRKMAFMFRNLLKMIHRILAFVSFKKFDRWLLPHASCVLIIDNSGKVLAVSRKDDLSKFGLPGGKVDQGETDLQAAVRELREETGISLIGWLDLEEIYADTDDFEYWTTCYRYVPRYKDPLDFEIKPEKNETGIVKLVDPSVLLMGPFSRYNMKVFEAVDSLNDGAYES